jgi:hypothetical protein
MLICNSVDVVLCRIHFPNHLWSSAILHSIPSKNVSHLFIKGCSCWHGVFMKIKALDFLGCVTVSSNRRLPALWRTCC